MSIPPHRIAVSILIAGLLGVAAAGLIDLVRPDPCDFRAPDWTLFPPPPVQDGSPADRPPLQVVSYNLHTGLGPRWALRAKREAVERHLTGIARHIHRSTGRGGPADLVALNEADFGSRRSDWLDQPAFLAAELGRLTGSTYRVVRGTTWTRDLPGLEVHFGNAALVRHPVLEAHSCVFGGDCLDVSSGESIRPLGTGRWFGPEPRSVLRIRVSLEGRPLDLLVTHLEAFFSSRRAVQAAELTRRFLRPGQTTLLLGDINATDGVMNLRRGYGTYDATLDLLAKAGLVDARVHTAARVGAGDLAPWATYPADRPDWPLDAIFATADLVPLAVHVIGDGEVSDHRGLRVRYAWSDPRVQADLGPWQAALGRRRGEQAAACTPDQP